MTRDQRLVIGSQAETACRYSVAADDPLLTTPLPATPQLDTEHRTRGA